MLETGEGSDRVEYATGTCFIVLIERYLIYCPKPDRVKSNFDHGGI